MEDTQKLIDDATLEFALGNGQEALILLNQAIEIDSDSYNAWLAKAEVLLGLKQLDEALTAGERAHSLKSQDILANTTLSRIWVALGNKEKAETFGAQARMLGWKKEITDSEVSD